MANKPTSKKDLKKEVEEMKLMQEKKRLEEKEALREQKRAMKEEKERRKNSFGRKVRNFFLTIILVAIVLLVGFYFGKGYLKDKKDELFDKKMGQIYQEAVGLINDKEYKKAIEKLNSIDEKYSKYNEVTDKLKEAENYYLNEYLTKADDYLKAEEFVKALDVLKEADKEIKDSKAVKAKRDVVLIAQLNFEVNKLVSKQADTIDILKFIVNFDDNDSRDIEKVKTELITKHKSTFLLETRTLMKTDYAKAKELIEEVKKILKDDKDIQKLVEEFDKIEPAAVNLFSVDYNISEGNLTISNGTKKIASMDSKVEYDKYILKPSVIQDATTNSTPYEVEFDLNKKYTTLKGLICTLSKQTGTANTSYEPVINFYGDRKLLFSTTDIKDSTFSIDVSDVQTLRIEFEGATAEEYFIANPELTPVK